MSPMMTLTTFLLGALYSIAPVMASMYGRPGFQQDNINQTVCLADNILTSLHLPEFFSQSG